MATRFYPVALERKARHTDIMPLAARVMPLALLVAMIAAAVIWHGSWMNPPAAYNGPLYDAQPIMVPANVAVIGDLHVELPAGRLDTAASSGGLRIRGWLAPARPGVQIREARILVDGKEIQPVDQSGDYRPDLARAFDRIELFYSGWMATLPLAPGQHPHSVELHAVLGDGHDYRLNYITLQ